MANRLSHSQATKYSDCSKAWEYHYVKKLRPNTTSSALLFGNILDESVERYLQSGDKQQARELLHERWTKQEINKKQHELYDCTLIRYSNSDYDSDLLLEEDTQRLTDEAGSDWTDKLKSIQNQKSAIGYDLLPKDSKVLLNKANWLSMLRKGDLMLDEAVRVIDNNLIKVHGTQVKVSLDNGIGDEIIGFADIVADWRGYDTPIVLDVKTSSIKYDPNSVKVSPQLSLYVHGLSDIYKTRRAGYFVLSKHIKKDKNKICSKCGYDGSGASHRTCPNEIDGVRCKGEWIIKISKQAVSDIIIDEIPERTEEIVIENMDMVNKSIKAGIYLRNLGSCVKPWGKCPYYDLCYHNSEKGLERSV